MLGFAPAVNKAEKRADTEPTSDRSHLLHHPVPLNQLLFVHITGEQVLRDAHRGIHSSLLGLIKEILY